MSSSPSSPFPQAYPNALSVLRELGEWMAFGFYEAENESWPMSYARSFRRLYEYMEITVPADRLLLPHEPLPQARTMESHQAWSAKALICDFDHHCGLRVNSDIAVERKQSFPQHAAFIDALVADLQRKLPHFGGYTHSNPDIRRVVSEGFDAITAELAGEIAACRACEDESAQEELKFLLALDDYAQGVQSFHARVVAALRAARHPVAAPLAHAFVKPARTFLEGMLAVNFIWMLDGCDSLGRLDQALGPLFDVEPDPELARRLLDELWQQFERLNAWNLQIGGAMPDGHDGTNRLTLECIAACQRNRARRPNVAFRITSRTPDAALRAALVALAEGSGRPALYNDDLYVQTLLKLGLVTDPVDAREVGFGGCTETMIGGPSNVGSLEGTLNLAKALELALHDGFDPVMQVQAGPHTGRFADFHDFPAFQRAVERQIQYLTDAFVAGSKQALRQRFTQGDPKLRRSLFTRDCVRRHRSFEAGGARYNWSVVSYQGIANLIDGCAAVRDCVFTAGTVGREELLDALAADFAGVEHIQRRLLAVPKFGNDIAAVDVLGRDLLQFAWSQLLAHEPPRGGRYVPSCILFTTYLGAGRQVGATPDGRNAFAVLTDSVGPVQGRDTHGPTAMLHSVAQLPLHLAIGTPVLNMRFQKSLFTQEQGLTALTALVRAFFAQGGMQVQISVLDRTELLAAQRQPTQYADLIVRIGGYSEYFSRLDPKLQDSVIARTEHGGAE